MQFIAMCNLSGVKPVWTRAEFKQDIEDLSIVDGIMDVFIRVCVRQKPLSGPLEDHRVSVLQSGSSRHFERLF